MSSKKPIVRWNIGDVSEVGFHILKTSVKNFKRLYGDSFDYCICYNSISPKDIDVPWILSSYKLPYSLPKKNPAWKLYPPRLDINRYEIILDNDLVIYNQMDIIERFLESDKIFVTEAFKRSYGYQFDHLIPKNLHINTGMMCFPPNFDFESKLINFMEDNPSSWQHDFDEQAMVASIISKENFELIPLDTISICFNSFKKGKCGIHFVGSNKGEDKYWKQFLI